MKYKLAEVAEGLKPFGVAMREAAKCAFRNERSFFDVPTTIITGTAY